jgi:light-independent protochlorophyllide reductase subunit B
MELARGAVVGREDAFTAGVTGASVRWSAEASARLERVPGFVRGMVKRIYADYAAERAIAEITPAVMDQARVELGLEGM